MSEVGSASEGAHVGVAHTLDAALDRLLRHMLTIGASDLYLTAGSPPVYRVDGVGHPGKRVPDQGELEGLAATLMTAPQRAQFAERLEMNLAVQRAGGRFRVNVFRQRGAVGMVIRLVRSEVKTLAELGLPSVLRDVAASKRGLVLVVGGTGSGKSTSLAAMLDHRNRSATGHILTIEDPIEYEHQHQLCVVTQREVGTDTHSYADALKSALRQTPDVVLIGEIRDAQTMEAALSFAETGHLCMSTLHANNANQALERILTFFPPERQRELLLQLSLNLRAVVSQRLIPARSGGRIAALEIMLDTPRIKDLVKRGEIEVLKDAMNQSSVEGCQTFDRALLALVASGRVDFDAAVQAADSPNNLRLALERVARGVPTSFRDLKLLEPAPRSGEKPGASPGRRAA